MVDPRLLEPTPKELARAASPATQWLMTVVCAAGVALGAVMGWTWGESSFADAGTTLGNAVPLDGGTLTTLYSTLAVACLSALLAVPILLGVWRDWRTATQRRVLIVAGAAGIVVAGLIGAVGFDPDRATVVERYGRFLGEPPEPRYGELVGWLGALFGLSWAFVALGVAVGALLALEIWLVQARGPDIVDRRRRAPAGASGHGDVARASPAGPVHRDVA